MINDNQNVFRCSVENLQSIFHSFNFTRGTFCQTCYQTYTHVCLLNLLESFTCIIQNSLSFLSFELFASNVSNHKIVTFQTNEVSCMGVTKIFFCTGSMCDQWFHLCLVVEVNPLVWQSVKQQLKTLFLCQWLLYRCHCRKTLSDTKQTFYYIKKQKKKIQNTNN